MKKYIPRVVDSKLKFKLKTFGAVNIIGPKWCGKTRTAEEMCNSFLYFQSIPDKDALISTASVNPKALLNGERPMLIDEWQDAPNIWDAVRFECDHSNGPGQFVLTGSTSKKVNTSHTGTGRISTLRMYPMSLYESGESNGSVSLSSLFDDPEQDIGCKSELTIENLIFAACRGGWPYSILLKDRESQLDVAKDYFNQIYTTDMYAIDGVKRKPALMQSILRSYGRNISTLAKKTSILKDVGDVSEPTLSDYIDVLKELFIIEDMNGWNPLARSSASARSGPKREFVDPSLVAAALGVSPEKLNKDLKTFGFIFECLCIRDLRVYSSPKDGKMSYYHDRLGLEADGVLHLEDGRYALFEFKLGSKEIDEGAGHLCKIEKKISEYNEYNSGYRMDLPKFKMVITGGEYGYIRPDGVYVVPIGCLGP